MEKNLHLFDAHRDTGPQGPKRAKEANWWAEKVSIPVRLLNFSEPSLPLLSAEQDEPLRILSVDGSARPMCEFLRPKVG
jgi:hypothetical protein